MIEIYFGVLIGNYMLGIKRKALWQRRKCSTMDRKMSDALKTKADCHNTDLITGRFVPSESILGFSFALRK